MQDPKIHQNFVDNGYEPQGDTPAEWAKIFRADVKRYAEIAKAANITLAGFARGSRLTVYTVPERITGGAK